MAAVRAVSEWRTLRGPAWSSITPFGRPVEPEVKITYASPEGDCGGAGIGTLPASSAIPSIGSTATVSGHARDTCSLVLTTILIAASEVMSSMRPRGSSGSRGT